MLIDLPRWQLLRLTVCDIRPGVKWGTVSVTSRKVPRGTYSHVQTFRKFAKTSALFLSWQLLFRRTFVASDFNSTSTVGPLKMASEESLADLQRRLVQLRVTAAKQNEDARSLRQQHAPAADIEAASIQLGKTRQEIVELEHKLLKHQGQNVPSFIKYKQQCENLLKRKFFVVPAFEIYGGVGGLYDFGPPGMHSGSRCKEVVAIRKSS